MHLGIFVGAFAADVDTAAGFGGVVVVDLSQLGRIGFARAGEDEVGTIQVDADAAAVGGRVVIDFRDIDRHFIFSFTVGVAAACGRLAEAVAHGRAGQDGLLQGRKLLEEGVFFHGGISAAGRIARGVRHLARSSGEAGL